MLRLFPIIIIFLFCVACLVQNATAELIKIGVSLPLSGAASSYGTPLQKILEFLNSETGIPKYSLVFEDDRCEPKQGVAIAKTFASTNHLSFVFGSPCSGVMLASAPIYERAGIIVMSLGAGAPSISQSGDYIFRARPSDLGAAKILSRYLKSRTRRLAILAEQTEYPQQLADLISQELRASDIAIFREDFISDSTDLPSLLLRIKSKTVDALLAIPQAEKGLIDIVRQVSLLNAGFSLYGSQFPGSPTFLSAVGRAAEGIEFATLPDRKEGLTPSGRETLRRLEESAGLLATVDYLFAMGDSAYSAIDQTIASGEDARKHLYSAQFKGAIGTFSFDRNGDLEGMNYVIQRIQKGNLITIFR